MREIVTVQVGQCGNQIGSSFWGRVLGEHGLGDARPVRGDGLEQASTYFYTQEDGRVRARAVLVDTEEGVLSQVKSGPLGQVFEETEFVQGVSGAGNNFAHGFFGYGAEYAGRIREKLRQAAEKCDSLQAFFLLHSTGGGTGSGLGSRVLSLMEDDFPEISRFTASVFPAEKDDVVTSPYNAALAVNELREHADCVFPLDNQALIDVSHVTVDESIKRKRTEKGSSETSKKNAFQEMNDIAAQMLSNLTCCARFHGEMNLDLSELSTNLVPFPRMQFITSSMSPLGTMQDLKWQSTQSKQIDRAFNEAFARSHQLLKVDPMNGKFLSCAFLGRGPIAIFDINRNVERLSRKFDVVSWNQDCFKIGLVKNPPLNHSHSLLTLSNNTGIAQVFKTMEDRFNTLYGPRRKAYSHHYMEYMEEDQFEQALGALKGLQEDYARYNNDKERGPTRSFLDSVTIL